MPMNRIQFQPDLSLPAFHVQFGTEAQCEAALEQARWPDGFRCTKGGHLHGYVLHIGAHKTFQCQACHMQTSLIAGTLFQSTYLALTLWFLAIYLVSQAKTGLSALARKHQLWVSYPTAWLIQHKLMQAMTERECAQRRRPGLRRLSRGKAGHGSENKLPFVAAVSLTPERHPLYTKMAPVSLASPVRPLPTGRRAT